MNLYDQLLKLQVIENAYADWAPYREKMTDYLIGHTQSGCSLAILGAGRCNDLDLARLAQHFGTLTLIDKDEESLRGALALYGLEALPHIQIQIKDFVGITPEDYRGYADRLIYEIRKKGTQTKVQDLAEVALAYLEELYERNLCGPLDLGENSYDYTLALGVHSQLISMLEWIWRMMLETLGQEEDTVRTTLIYMNDACAQKFNDAVLNATKDTTFIGLETARINREGTIQGAIQGIKDIERRLLKGKIKCLDRREFEWPFDPLQAIHFHVQVYQLHK